MTASLVDETASPLARLAPRPRDAHKGDFGRVLVVGGSRGMAGAPALCGLSAMRSGAGLVTVAVPSSVQETVASFSPCYMTSPLIEDDEGAADLANVVDLAAAYQSFDAWAVGPGLRRTAGVVELVAQLYRSVPRTMIVDADGLYALAETLRRNPRALDSPPGPRVLTPHEGEFSRLTGEPASRDAAERAEQAARLCRADSSQRTIVVLKGSGTIVTDGRRVAVNSTGNPGLATGGTGDCLTGVLAGLCPQCDSVWEAARLGVHVHGLAGDVAAAELGEVSLIASDLPNYLPKAFQQLARDR